MRILVVLVIALTLLAGCAGQPSPASVPPSATPAPSPTPTPQAAAATATPLPPTPTPRPAFNPGAVILPTVAAPTVGPTPTPADPLAATLDEIGSRTTIIRQLFAVRPMDRNFITREDLSARLREDLEEDIGDITESQELYLTLGILKDNEDLFDILLALLSEQVLGFFDTEEEKLYVVRDDAEFGPTDKLTYAHEFVHGLQQQHFDIHATREGLKGNSDKVRAFRGLVEGDATLTQTIYMFTQFDEAEQQAVMQEAQSSDGQDAFEAAPHLVQRAILFPYNEGPQFVFTLYRIANQWDPIDQAFKEPPQSTEQILHPEKYVFNEKPLAVELPDIAQALGEGWTQITKDTFGEFFLRAHLEADVELQSAAIAAEGWGGDSYALLKGPQEKRLLVSRISWDSEEDAQEFSDTFQEFMRARTGAEWKPSADDAATLLLDAPTQSVLLSLSGVDTLLIFSPDADITEKARGTLQAR